MSTIRNFTDNIDTNFPVQGRDNPSQGFRDNFAQIKLALLTTADKVSDLENKTSQSTFTLTPATTASNGNGILGGIIVGDGFNYNKNTGLLSVATVYELPIATPSVLGGVKIGPNITISGDGSISVAAPYQLTAASTSTLGGVKVGNGLVIDNDEFLSVDTNFPFDIPVATPAVAGIVKIGANIAVSEDGTISVTTPYQLPAATDVTLGGVIIGSGIDVAVDGTISVNTGTPYVLPISSSTVLGGIKIGNGLLIDESGVASVATASDVTLGGVIIGENINLLDGVISVAAPYVLPTASTVTKGGIQVGNGLFVDGSGFLNVQFEEATTSTIGAITGEVGTIVVLGDRTDQWTENGQFSVSVGAYAGNTLQGSYSVAIGAYAGLENQGAFSVALGLGAGQINQPDNSIIINATSGQLNADDASALYIAPLRERRTSNVMYYNTTSYEVSHGPFVLANYTTATLNTIVSTATGAVVLVTNLPGGGLPCFYDGSRWRTFGGTAI
jgi:hypothetical protein